MSKVLALEKSTEIDNCQDPFLEELIKQIRRADTFSKYCDWSDELLVNQLVISPEREAISSKNLNFDSLHQLLPCFYNAMGAIIERKTGHPTDTFVHLKNKEFSSVVISCGGVLVIYSLIWGYRSFGFISLEKLIESAETNISDAVSKASQYLDFVG